MLWKGAVVVECFNNYLFNILSNTTVCLLLRTATCFGRNRSSSGCQYSVLNQGKNETHMKFKILYNFIYCVDMFKMLNT